MDTKSDGLENVSRCKCGIMLGIFVKFRGSTCFLVHKTPRISIIWVLAFLFYMASWLKKGRDLFFARWGNRTWRRVVTLPGLGGIKHCKSTYSYFEEIPSWYWWLWWCWWWLWWCWWWCWWWWCIVWVGNIMTFENLFSLKLAHVFFGGLQGSCPLLGG